MNCLQDAEDRTLVSSFIWTKYLNVTDGQTDLPCYYSSLHCEHCGRAVKTDANFCLHIVDVAYILFCELVL